MENKQVTHNPGRFKQQNKPHKTGRHRSKSEIDKTNKGKVGIKSLTKRNKQDAQNKDQRKNRLNQIRKNKREQILNKKRSIGSLNGCPHIISIIPLSTDVNCMDVIEQINNSEPESKKNLSETGIYTIESPRFKSKYNFIIPNPMNTNAVLDTLKVTDTCLFILSAKNGMDSFGEALFEMIYSYHFPTSLFIAQGIKNLPPKIQGSTKDNLQKVITSKGLDSKVLTLDSESDGLNLLHKISQHKLIESKFNAIRSFIMAEKVEYEPYKINPEMGTLKLYGYLRGQNLSANSLIHMPSLGTYQMSEIYALKKIMDQENWELVQKADPSKQDSLETEAHYDELNAEQTWPTEQELNDAQIKRVKKKVPKGTSEYQAAWILDSEEEEITDDDDDDDDEDKENESLDEEEDDDESIDDSESEEEMETLTIGGEENNKYDENIDLDEEQTTLEKMREARSHAQFPDEVDTPLDQPARIRFQKYRGLKSFRTSPWDRYENLPLEYARIFQFEDIKKTFKKVSKERLDGAEAGQMVCVHIKNVPSSIQILPGHPIVAYGLLRHENKMSLINLKLKRVNLSLYNLPIKSKERLVYHVGCRRFEADAIFSQHSNGDKHKFERFMPEDCTFVASLFAPITFAPASVLVFKKMENGDMVLIATGAVLSIDPNRIMLKRIVISGHPFKVSNKNAVVRYMFFNPDDVNWFKPVELRTKYGRRGHIKEPLGTHGHMKCQFNDTMKSQDTVLMNLYKRVYPKWTYSDKSNDFNNNQTF
ncbi:pre-rRNA-processing TSR1 -like protein [Brachionus plicatilis]|uniref:Pre-rRNA-processing protein TSR1 homolog n=1 Tax=Brachionus plicatilis TaxID=10195 RepID=A0A3M7S8T2_BRAPC|nr:pre-rRNA-processing TSR1 -like protein [Brachionus plicatilis]